ncbi:MAG: hydroxymyristoyl-ACP dehydratase [Treponema sp.]|nr:hydroxymyristoyl-ACP dehydratase [Treponema sp.]
MNFHGIGNEKVISSSPEKVELEFLIPSSSDYFDGHFPQFKLLPAVAQTYIAVNFSAEYFSLSKDVSKIKRLKFVQPILPDTKVILVLEYNSAKNSVSFEFSDADAEGKLYSTGAFFLRS